MCFRSGWWWLSLPSPCISSLRRVNWDISYITHSLPRPCLYWYMCMFIWVGDIYTYIYIHTYISISLLLYGVGSSYSPCLQTVWDIDRRVSGTVPKPIAIAHRPSPSPTPPPPDPRTACALIGTSAPPEPVVMFIGCILASLIAFVPVRTSAPIWALRPGNRCASRCPTAVWEMVNGIVQSVLGGVRGSLYQCCCSSSRPPSGCVCWPWLLLLDPRLSTLDSRILLLFPPPSHPLALSLSLPLSPPYSSLLLSSSLRSPTFSGRVMTRARPGLEYPQYGSSSLRPSLDHQPSP